MDTPPSPPSSPSTLQASTPRCFTSMHMANGGGELPVGESLRRPDAPVFSAAVELARNASQLTLSVSGPRAWRASVCGSAASAWLVDDCGAHLIAPGVGYGCTSCSVPSQNAPFSLLRQLGEASAMQMQGAVGLADGEPTDTTNQQLTLTQFPSQAVLSGLPNEVLLQILGYLEVCDLLATSRTSRHLRVLSLAPILHALRLRRTRAVLPPLLSSPSRPTLAELIARSIFLTNTTVVSRKLARSLVSIRLSRRLAARPPAEVLVARSVLLPECVPGSEHGVAPALVAKKRAVEKERVKDGLRRWVGAVFRGEVRERGEGIKKWEEHVGVGRVWRLRKFWERVSRGEIEVGGN